MTDQELQMCPCCGNEKSIDLTVTGVSMNGFHYIISKGDSRTFGSYSATVKCSMCGLQITRSAKSREEADRLAKEAWNTRPTCGEWRDNMLFCQFCGIPMEEESGDHCPVCGRLIIEPKE